MVADQRNAGLAEAAADRCGLDHFRDAAPAIWVLELRGDQGELAAGPNEDRGEFGHPGHAAVQHHDIKSVFLGQAADLLGVPDENGRRRVDERPRRDEALRIGQFHRHDDVDVLGVEQLRGGRGLCSSSTRPAWTTVPYSANMSAISCAAAVAAGRMCAVLL